MVAKVPSLAAEIFKGAKTDKFVPVGAEVCELLALGCGVGNFVGGGEGVGCTVVEVVGGGDGFTAGIALGWFTGSGDGRPNGKGFGLGSD